VECKFRCNNIRRISDPGSIFLLAFTVTGISDDWYSTTMGVIVIGLRIPRSAGENCGCIWEHQRHVLKHLGAPVTSLGAQVTSLEALATSLEVRVNSLEALATTLRVPGTSLEAPPIAVEQSGKTTILFGNCAGASGNYKYYVSFNNC
jgi:hypothetical protein